MIAQTPTIITHRRRWGRRPEVESHLIADALRLPPASVRYRCDRLATQATAALVAGYVPTAGIVVTPNDRGKDTPFTHWALIHPNGSALEPSIKQFARPACLLIPTDTTCPWCGAPRRADDKIDHWRSGWATLKDCMGRDFDLYTDARRILAAFSWRMVWRDTDYHPDLRAIIGANPPTTPEPPCPPPRPA